MKMGDRESWCCAIKKEWIIECFGENKNSRIPGSLATFCHCATGGEYHSTMISSQDSSRPICHEEKESWNIFVKKEWWMVEWCKITVTSQYIRIEWRPAVEWTQLSYVHHQTHDSDLFAVWMRWGPPPVIWIRLSIGPRFRFKFQNDQGTSYLWGLCNAHWRHG